MNPMDETRTAGKSDTPYIISAWNFPADISITGNDITRIMFHISGEDAMIPVIVTPEFGKVLHDMVWHCPRVQGDKRPMIEVRCTMHTGEVKILTLAFTYNVMISANENAGPTYLAYFNLISITKPSCDTSGTPNSWRFPTWIDSNRHTCDTLLISARLCGLLTGTVPYKNEDMNLMSSIIGAQFVQRDGISYVQLDIVGRHHVDCGSVCFTILQVDQTASMAAIRTYECLNYEVRSATAENSTVYTILCQLDDLWNKTILIDYNIAVKMLEAGGTFNGE